MMCINTHLRAPIESREVIRRLEVAAWELVAIKGSHHQFRHPSRPGRVTVPHTEKDIPIGTLRSIERQSGLKLRR